MRTRGVDDVDAEVRVVCWTIPVALDPLPATTGCLTWNTSQYLAPHQDLRCGGPYCYLCVP